MILAILQLPFFTVAQSSAQPTVDLGYAQYAGEDIGNGVSQFLGLRYAKAPVDDLRWAAPRLPDNTTGVMQANQVSDAQLLRRTG